LNLFYNTTCQSVKKIFTRSEITVSSYTTRRLATANRSRVHCRPCRNFPHI